MFYEKDHHDIIQALDQDMVRRLRNWVDWRGGGSTSCSSSWVLDYGTVIHSGYREATMPLLVAEAELLERCLRMIPDELFAAVALFWLADGMSFVEMGARLGCADKTAKARVIRGHAELRSKIYAQQPAAMLDAKRERRPAAGPRDRPTSGPVIVLTNTDSEI